MEHSERSALHKDMGEPPPGAQLWNLAVGVNQRLCLTERPKAIPVVGAEVALLLTLPHQRDTHPSGGRHPLSTPSGVRTLMSRLRTGCQLCSAPLHGMAGAMRRNYYSSSFHWSRHFNWPIERRACPQTHETCYSIASYRRVSATT